MDPQVAFLSNFITEDLYLIDKVKSVKVQEPRLAKILVVTEDELTPEKQVFLEKIFSAVGLQPEDFEHQVHSSAPATDHSMMFFFGSPSPQHSPYAPSKNQQGQTQIYAHSLAVLQNDQEKKRALWQVLKQVFDS